MCWASCLPTVCKLRSLMERSELPPELLLNFRKMVQAATRSFISPCPFLACPNMGWEGICSNMPLGRHLSLSVILSAVTDGDKCLPSNNTQQLCCPEEQPLRSFLPVNPCPGLSRHFPVCQAAFAYMLALLHLHNLSPWTLNSACTSTQPCCMSCRKLPVAEVREAASLEDSCGSMLLCQQYVALHGHSPAQHLAFRTPSVCSADSGLSAKPHGQ